MNRWLISIFLPISLTGLNSLDGLTMTYNRDDTVREFTFNRNIQVSYNPLTYGDAFYESSHYKSGNNPIFLSMSGGKYRISFSFEKDSCLLPFVCSSAMRPPKLSIKENGFTVDCGVLSFDGWLTRVRRFRYSKWRNLRIWFVSSR